MIIKKTRSGLYNNQTAPFFLSKSGFNIEFDKAKMTSFSRQELDNSDHRYGKYNKTGSWVFFCR